MDKLQILDVVSQYFSTVKLESRLDYKGEIVKKNMCLLLIVLVSLALQSCLIDDLADAIDDALDEDGDKACYEAVENMINKIEGCDKGYLQEGENAEDKAKEWCSAHCDSLGHSVEYADYADCTVEIGKLNNCEDVTADPAQIMEVSGCDWVANVVKCE